MDLANSKKLSMLFHSFAKACSPQDLRPQAWDVVLVLQSLINQPYEPIREAEERFVAHKTLFLIALASAKRVGELHALSYRVSHSADRKEVSFSFVPASWPKQTSLPSIHGSRTSRYWLYQSRAALQTEDSCVRCERSNVTWTAPPSIARDASGCSSPQDAPRRRFLRTPSPSGSVR